jgi:peptide/nickel transport system permease protein
MKTELTGPVAGQSIAVEAPISLRVGPRQRELVRLLRRLGRIDGIIALMLVALILICLVGAPVITRYDPYVVDITAISRPPSAQHWMGTDEYGRDIYTRVVYGTRYSLATGLAVSLISTIIGLVLGGVAGFFGGRVDEIIMRFTDMVMGFPGLLFAMVIAAVLGSGLTTAIMAACAIWWPSYVRLMRGQVLSVKNELFVEAALSVGASTRRILLRHILPNSWAPIIVRNTMDLGRAVIFTGTLSFIGLGAEPPMPEWGTMLAEARSFILSSWWYITFPGLAIFATVFAFSLLGDIVDEMLRHA